LERYDEKDEHTESKDEASATPFSLCYAIVLPNDELRLHRLFDLEPIAIEFELLKILSSTT
jgi:hypothetical protein